MRTAGEVRQQRQDFKVRLPRLALLRLGRELAREQTQERALGRALRRKHAQVLLVVRHHIQPLADQHQTACSTDERGPAGGAGVFETQRAQAFQVHGHGAEVEALAKKVVACGGTILEHGVREENGVAEPFA